MNASDAPRSITIRDVAALAGVSIKTVSRVLNCEPGVIPETQALVRAAVERLNYTPNPSARNLASVAANMVGLAYSHVNLDEDERGGHQYGLILQIGALAACEQHEFGLLPMPCDPRQADLGQHLLTRVRERRLSGLVIAAPLSNAPGALEAIRAARVPHVCINPNELADGAPYVAIDETLAAYEMTQHLIANGHRRIGFIKGVRGSRVSRERCGGYRKAMAEHGLDVDPAWIAQGDFTFKSGQQCARDLLRLSAPPSAIFASNDDMAVGVMHAAYAAGVRIPHDLSVAGFDDNELARFSWPPLTTIRQPLEKMAHTAIEQLIGILRPNRVGLAEHPLQLLFPCELIARDSVRHL